MVPTFRMIKLLYDKQCLLLVAKKSSHHWWKCRHACFLWLCKNFRHWKGWKNHEKILKRTLILKSNKGGENLNCNCNLERKFNSCLGSFIFQGFLEGCRVVYNRVRPQERLRSRQIVAVFADVTRKTWWRKKRNGQKKNIFPILKRFFSSYLKWKGKEAIKNHVNPLFTFFKRQMVMRHWLKSRYITVAN